MNLPDRGTLGVWYHLLLLAIVTSIALAQFAEIRFLHSIWFTIPVWLIGGHSLWRWWFRAIDNRAAQAAAPLETRIIAGLGELKRFPDRWDCVVTIDQPGGPQLSIDVAIDADDEGPSRRQLGCLREFKRRFLDMRPQLLDELNKAFPTSFDEINPDGLCLEVSADRDDSDLEVCFFDHEGPDGMLYICELKNWQVVGVYGSH